MGLLDAAGQVISGILNNKAAKKQNDTNYRRDARQDYVDRRRYLNDLKKAKQYARKITKNDRAYAAKLTASDRAYAKEQLLGDRAYAEKISARDRAQALALRAQDVREYKADRADMQKLSNELAEESAASRAIDFKALRDDATAAGFNPLTALGFANSYSRAVDYNLAGGPMSGGQLGGGGTAVPLSSPSGSQTVGSTAAATGAYQGSGNGYSSQSLPVLSTGAFIAEALGEAANTFFNDRAAQDDVTYQTIADQVAAGQIAREVARQTPRDFGFALSKVQPFEPGVKYTPTPVIPSQSAPDLWHPGFETDKQPVQTLPLTGGYSIWGSTVRGLSQDVEWSEITQTLNELAIAGQIGYDQVKKSEPELKRLAQKGVIPSVLDQLWNTAKSYTKTGVKPVWTPF